MNAFFFAAAVLIWALVSIQSVLHGIDLTISSPSSKTSPRFQLWCGRSLIAFGTIVMVAIVAFTITTFSGLL